MPSSSKKRPLGSVAVGPCQRLPVEQSDMQRCSISWRLGILQWARSNGCEWDASLFVVAAKRGHLEILQWAHANGLWFWLESCLTPAEENGHWEVADWLKANFRD